MSNDRAGAIAAVAGPVVLLAGILWHPFIADLRNNADVVHHMAEDTTRWFGSHLLVAIGAAGVLLAFSAARAHVRASVGTEPWTGRAIVPLTIGTVLFALLPGMEIAVMAAHEAGADALAVQNSLDTWFTPILIAGSVLFAVGSFLFAHGIRRAQILPTGTTGIVVAGLSVSALSRFVPMTPSLMIGIAALVVAFSPLALSMWRSADATAQRAAQYARV